MRVTLHWNTEGVDEVGVAEEGGGGGGEGEEAEAVGGGRALVEQLMEGQGAGQGGQGYHNIHLR